MITALVVVSIIMGYLIGGGIMGGLTFAHLYDPDDRADDSEFPAFFVGVFWPLVLPVLLGVWIAQIPMRARQRAVEAERRTRELEKELGMLPPATDLPKPRLPDPYRIWGGPV